MVFTCSQLRHNLEFVSFQAIFAGGWLGALKTKLMMNMNSMVGATILNDSQKPPCSQSPLNSLFIQKQIFSNSVHWKMYFNPSSELILAEACPE